MMFECVMFLKANINEWDLNFVAQALAGKDHKVAENNADFELVAGMMEGLDVMEEDWNVLAIYFYFSTLKINIFIFQHPCNKYIYAENINLFNMKYIFT